MRVFVCSPLRGDIERNINVALSLCHKVALMGHAPFAPHVFCTRFLNDDVETERNCGINIGLEFLRVCDELWFYTETGKVSTGMAAEIAFAQQRGIPVREFPATPSIW